MVLSYLATINVILAAFNMFPAFPMDSGCILRAYLWHRNGDILNATKIAARSGTAFGYILMAFGALAVLRGGVAAGL